MTARRKVSGHVRLQMLLGLTPGAPQIYILSLPRTSSREVAHLSVLGRQHRKAHLPGNLPVQPEPLGGNCHQQLLSQHQKREAGTCKLRHHTCRLWPHCLTWRPPRLPGEALCPPASTLLDGGLSFRRPACCLLACATFPKAGKGLGSGAPFHHLAPTRLTLVPQPPSISWRLPGSRQRVQRGPSRATPGTHTGWVSPRGLRPMAPEPLRQVMRGRY